MCSVDIQVAADVSYLEDAGADMLGATAGRAAEVAAADAVEIHDGAVGRVVGVDEAAGAAGVQSEAHGKAVGRGVR